MGLEFFSRKLGLSGGTLARDVRVVHVAQLDSDHTIGTWTVIPSRRRLM
jgi:hypothetical protein